MTDRMVAWFSRRKWTLLAVVIGFVTGVGLLDIAGYRLLASLMLIVVFVIAIMAILRLIDLTEKDNDEE